MRASASELLLVYPLMRHFATTVVAPTAALADALSTAFHVLGPEGALAYCTAHPEIGALLILRAYYPPDLARSLYAPFLTH